MTHQDIEAVANGAMAGIAALRVEALRLAASVASRAGSEPVAWMIVDVAGDVRKAKPGGKDAFPVYRESIAPAAAAEPTMDAMVNRFLSWKLPPDFSPDAGITFKRVYNETSPFGPQNHEPTGTNLLTGAQARAMLEHVVGADRERAASLVASEGWQPIASAPTDGSKVLTWWAGEVRTSWCEGKGASRDGGDWWRSASLTVTRPGEGRPMFWMPLPKPPSPDRASAGEAQS